MTDLATSSSDYTSILQKKLSDRIKSAFIELIPEEQFDGMIADAMDALQNGEKHKRFEQADRKAVPGDAQYEPNSNSWNQTTVRAGTPKAYDVHLDPNTIPGMVYTELKKQAVDQIKALLNEPQYIGVFKQSGMGREVVEGYLKDFLTNNSGLIVQQMFGNIMSNAVMNVRDAMGRSNGTIGSW